MSYINVNDVRIAGGFPAELISDNDISHCLSVVEEYVERSTNTSFTPVQRIEFHDGTNTEFFYTLKNPVLRVDYLESYNSEIDLENIWIERESGKISLKNTANVSRFFGMPNGIRVRYWTAFLINDKSFKTISADVSKGSGVSIVLDDATGLEENDWVEIKNVDGTFTSVKILSVLGNVIDVDNLLIDVKSNSTLTKLIIPEYIKRFIELEAVIYLALNAIGATYVFNASYSLGDLNVTKGVPYTHWRESLEKAIKERNTLRNIVKPRFKIM
jgi:hypothetical protein